MTSKIAYERVHIHATLRCSSDLHIGDGSEASYHPNVAKSDDPARHYSPVCKDHRGLPTLPASTLRGWLRAQLGAQPSIDEDDVTHLLGSAKDKLLGNAGALRIYDAQFAEKQKHDANKRTRTAIEPITRTAKENHLFTHEVVSSGSRFQLHCTLRHITETQLNILVAGLKLLRGDNPHAQIGKGRALLQGQLQCDTIELTGITTDAFKQWVLDDQNTPLAESMTAITCQADERVQPQSEHHTQTLYLQPHAPILVNDIHRVSGIEKEPKFQFTRDAKGHLVIPATSLKGVLRHHCRKILLTLLQQSKTEATYKQQTITAGELLSRIFGSTGHISPLRIGDARSSQRAQAHEQTFNAVDRFTGGVADTALYSAVSGIASSLEMTLQYPKAWQHTPCWQAGLLLFALRDAMEGDLYVGWGQARGYGAITLTLTDPGEQLADNQAETPWALLLTQIEQQQPDYAEHAVNALHTTLENTLINTIADQEKKKKQGDAP